MENKFYIIWIIICGSPLIVAILVSVNILDIPVNNDWIGFYAALFGGLLSGMITYYSMFLSMTGVNEQIEEQKTANKLLKDQLNNEKEKYTYDKMLTLRPYLNIFSGEEISAMDYTAHIFEVYYDEYIYIDKIKFKIKNIGVGPIVALRIIGIRDFDNGEVFEPVNREIKSLGINDVMGVHINLMTKVNYLCRTNFIDIEYCDILNNLYRQTIEVVLFRKDDGTYDKCLVNNISKQTLVVESDGD